MRDFLVSIIIPVFNVEEYLPICVDSVLNQSHENLEIFLIDDGSTDSSGELCDQYMVDDERIHVIHQDNHGLSHARNVGMELSTGEYIYFLDSDDFIDRDAIRKLLDKMIAMNLDALFFDAAVVDELGVLDMRDCKYVAKNVYDKLYTGKTFYIEKVRNNDYRACVPMIFFRKSFLDNNKLNFIEGILHEDEIFTLNFLMCDGGVSHLHERLYLRRNRLNSIMTSKKTVKNYDGYKYYLSSLVGWCEIHQRDKKILAALRKSIEGILIGISIIYIKFDLRNKKAGVYYLFNYCKIIYRLSYWNQFLVMGGLIARLNRFFLKKVKRLSLLPN